MILLCLFTLLVAGVACVPVESLPRKISGRITGTGYTEIRKVPYQAQLIRDDSNLFCGATIIDREWLLTASHCFIDTSINVTVLTGSTFRLNGKESYIDRVFTHPQFNENNLNNDICLLKLKEPLEFNDKQKSIPMLYEDLKVGEMVQISGYGRESDFSLHSPVIKVADVPVVNKDECRNKYAQVNDTITDSMFCAGDGQEDACLGDSGGPTVYNGFLVGVISAGRFCRSKEFPGVYTRLSVYWDWINKTMSSNSASSTANKDKLKTISAGSSKSIPPTMVKPMIPIYSGIIELPPYNSRPSQSIQVISESNYPVVMPSVTVINTDYPVKIPSGINTIYVNPYAII